MSLWVIVIIVVTIAMVVGPVAMLQPSKRDRRLTELRQAAAQKGIRVRLASLQLASGKQNLAVYSVSLPTSDTPYHEWLLIHQSFVHEMHFSGQWDWDNAQSPAPSHMHAGLQQYIQQLDQHIVGIEVTQHSVGVYWSERGATIEHIESLLQQVKDTIVLA
jgi:type II secretory pathway pseudopilin PulG